MAILDRKALLEEFRFRAVRSSGSGGQHVNKVSTKVELAFNVSASLVLSTEQKQRLLLGYANKLTKDGVLLLSSDKTRSQFRNKADVTQRCFQLLEAGLTEQKMRKPTRVPNAVKRKRLNDKRRLSEKKLNRKPPKTD